MYDDHIYRVTVFFIVHVKLSKQSPRTELDGVTTRDEETFFLWENSYENKNKKIPTIYFNFSYSGEFHCFRRGRRFVLLKTRQDNN